MPMHTNISSHTVGGPIPEVSKMRSIRQVMRFLMASLITQIALMAFLSTTLFIATHEQLDATMNHIGQYLGYAQSRFSQTYRLGAAISTLVHSEDAESERRAYIEAYAMLMLIPSDVSNGTHDKAEHLRIRLQKLWDDKVSLRKNEAKVQSAWRRVLAAARTVSEDRFPAGIVDDDAIYGHHSTAMEEEVNASSTDQLDRFATRVDVSTKRAAYTVEQISALYGFFVDPFEVVCRAQKESSDACRTLMVRAAELETLTYEHVRIQRQIDEAVRDATTSLLELKDEYLSLKHLEVKDDITKIRAHIDALRPGAAVFVLLNLIEFLIFGYFALTFALPIERTHRIIDEFTKSGRYPKTLPKSDLMEVQRLLNLLPRLLAILKEEQDQTASMTNERDGYRRQAHTDALTGLRNRSALEVFLGKDAPARPKTAMLMIDIDHFKPINDRYGHPFGDLVIHEVGRALRTNLSQRDRVYRYGGEEFCVVIDDVTKKQLAMILERLRLAVSQLDLRHASGEHCRVTISLGASVAPEEGATTLRTLLKRADTALYEAKMKGRDRFVICRPEKSEKSEKPEKAEKSQQSDPSAPSASPASPASSGASEPADAKDVAEEPMRASSSDAEKPSAPEGAGVDAGERR